MIKAIKKLRNRAIILAILEILLLLFVNLAYAINIFNIGDFFTPLIVFIFSGSLVLVNVIAFVLITLSIGSIRKKNTFELVSVLGGDVKEAYNFGMLGLVVVDEHFNVTWASELFKERRLNIIDQNILTWRSELQRLVELSEAIADNIDDTIKIEIELRTYEVKYLTKGDIFLFKDVTEFESIFNDNQKNAPVLGMVMIDNFVDIVVKGENSNPVFSTVHGLIADYFSSFGVLARQFREDAYMLILNRERFEMLYKDKFSLLQKIKDRTANMNYQISLSMAFAHKFFDVVKLNELVLNAIDTAMARGGDQVVIARHGEESEFIGGATSQAEKRNKTAIRLYADTIFRHIREAKNVLIMTHTDTDLDALGASLGIKAMADFVKKSQKGTKYQYQPARIVYSPNLTESKTRIAVNRMFTKQEISEIFITPEELDDQKGSNSLVNSGTLLIVGDVSRPTMTLYPRLLERVDRVMIIDHHRRTDEFIDQRLYDYIETSASSTCEIVTELLHYGNTPNFVLPNKYATFMLAGIYLDTNYFRTKTTGSRTFLASMILEEWGADVMTADDFLKDNVEEYTLITKIMNSMKTLSVGIVFLKAEESDILTPETLSKVANQSMRIKGIQAAFVIGYTAPKQVKVSARSDGEVNVQFLLEKIGGGGHQASAAALFNGRTLAEVEELIEVKINENLSEARVVGGKKV
ncbi:MAG: DHH family phosphoesterase [Bacilli bacterium]|nr:DHH family phosphoesterase [Bacilli bacterium]